MTNESKSGRERLLHITKREFSQKWKAYAVRAVAFLLAILICGIVSTILTKKGMGRFFYDLFDGAFGTERRLWDLFHNTALLLLVALAVTPAFKMKFWNIGAEGQVLMGALSCMLCMHYFGGKIGNGGLIAICFASALIGGMLWAVIPALFKAKWNTNETLFTLMMNYVAIQLIVYITKVWEPMGTGSLTPSAYGQLPRIAGENFWLTIIVAVLMTAVMFVYLRYSKHGYEISVVGESENTARYIGINVRKVIIRTLIFSGVLCGLVGFLQVAGFDYTVSDTTAGGRGFTAILVSWLAKFNPIMMIFTAFLVVFLERGMGEVMTQANVYNSFFSGVVTGIMFLAIIGCEFFINYKIVFRHRAAVSAPPAPLPPIGAAPEELHDALDPEVASKPAKEE